MRIDYLSGAAAVAEVVRRGSVVDAFHDHATALTQTTLRILWIINNTAAHTTCSPQRFVGTPPF